MQIAVEFELSENQPTIARMHVSGAIDLESRAAFMDTVEGAFANAGVLALDLGQVHFIDSLGLGALLEITRTAEARSATFAIVGRSPQVQRVLVTAGLADYWPTGPLG